MIVTVFFAFAVILYFLANRRRNAYPLPPGPPAHPILGHLRMLPPQGMENTLFEWSKTYGSDIAISLASKDVQLTQV